MQKFVRVKYKRGGSDPSTYIFFTGYSCLDILDIAWSPDDSLLATGSIDNSIIIWDAKNFPESHYIIKGHVGLVKGVVFDPVGKYLASQVNKDLGRLSIKVYYLVTTIV